MESYFGTASQIIDRQRARYVLLSVIAMLAVIGFGSIRFIALGQLDLLWFLLLPTAACLVAPGYVRRGGRALVAEHLLLSSALAGVLGMAIYTGGASAGGLIWAVFLPALATIMSGRRAGIVYAAISFVCLLGILVIHRDGIAPKPLSASYALDDLLVKAPFGLIAVTALAVAVEHRLVAIREALSQHQQTRLLGKLTGSVAHDFNNLLSVIVGNLDLLEEDVADRPESRKLTREIRSAALSGSELVHGLQSLARQQRTEPQLTALGPRLRDSLALIDRTVSKQGIAIELDDTTGGALANIDPALFDSAILNLCVNARDAMPEGGEIRLRASCPTPDTLRVEVEDSGRGMSADVLRRAAEPFFSTKGGEGSGLGLPMVRAFAEDAGGRFRLSSTPGVGTRVSLDLPVHAGLAPVPAEEAAAPRGRGSILIVDDEPALRQVLSRLLESLGYQVSAACDAREAREILASGVRFGLVLTDWVMPGDTDGYQLARWITQEYPEQKVLIATGASTEAPARSEPGFPVIGKPYTREELGRRVMEIMNTASNAA